MQKKILFFILFFVPSAFVYSTPFDQLADELIISMKDKDLKKIFVVMPFEARGEMKGTDEDATAGMIGALSKYKIQIADRDTALLNEMELNQMGVGDTKYDLTKVNNGQIAIIGIVHYLQNERKKYYVKAVDLKTYLILSSAEVVDGKLFDFEIMFLAKKYDPIFYDTLFGKMHWSFFVGSGFQNSFLAPVEKLNTVYLMGPPVIYWMRMGYPINNQLVLFAHVQTSLLFSPFLSASNNIVRDPQLKDVTVTLLDMGVGFAYYFLPSRFFISLSLGDSSALYENTSDNIDINSGFGLNLSVGYHRKVTRSFGLGFLVGLLYNHLEFTDINVTIPTTSGYVNDSTFNIDSFTLYAGVYAAIN